MFFYSFLPKHFHNHHADVRDPPPPCFNYGFVVSKQNKTCVKQISARAFETVGCWINHGMLMTLLTVGVVAQSCNQTVSKRRVNIELWKQYRQDTFREIFD